MARKPTRIKWFDYVIQGVQWSVCLADPETDPVFTDLDTVTNAVCDQNSALILIDYRVSDTVKIALFRHEDEHAHFYQSGVRTAMAAQLGITQDAWDKAEEVIVELISPVRADTAARNGWALPIPPCPAWPEKRKRKTKPAI